MFEEHAEQEVILPKLKRWMGIPSYTTGFCQEPLPEFNGGGYVEYREFKRAFQKCLGKTDISDYWKLQTLISTYNGPFKESLEACLLTGDLKKGYEGA